MFSFSGCCFSHQYLHSFPHDALPICNSLVLNNISAGDAGVYSVVSSGTCGTPVTNSASLTVNKNVSDSSAPVSLTNFPCSPASFSVSASGTGLTYQWYKISGAMDGQT